MTVVTRLRPTHVRIHDRFTFTNWSTSTREGRRRAGSPAPALCAEPAEPAERDAKTALGQELDNTVEIRGIVVLTVTP